MMRKFSREDTERMRKEMFTQFAPATEMPKQRSDSVQQIKITKKQFDTINVEFFKLATPKEEESFPNPKGDIVIQDYGEHINVEFTYYGKDIDIDQQGEVIGSGRFIGG